MEEGEAAPPQLGAPADKLILVVDDDENVRSLIEMNATMEGFQVITATDGRDATKKVELLKTPDLIITDLMMPGEGGYELLRNLQAGGNGNIPVFVVTGSSLDSSTVAMIRSEANVVEFVPKPIQMATFVLNLHKHLKTAPAKKDRGNGLGGDWSSGF